MVLFCEICEICKHTYFEEHLRMTASDKHRHGKQEPCSRNEHYRYSTVRNVCLPISTWTKDSNSGVIMGKYFIIMQL